MTTMAASEIRYLTGNDASEYWRLRREALEGDPEAFSASAPEHRTLSLDEMRKRLGSEGGDQFVVGAEQGGRLIGRAGFYRTESEDPSQGAHLGRLYDAGAKGNWGRQGDVANDSEARGRNGGP
jgi:predicted N-acetyltransferase YhbS